MKKFEFTLKFSTSEHETEFDAHMEALGNANCTDAAVGIGQSGRIALAFKREGRSALEAAESAIADVKQAIPGAKFVEATPDLSSML